MNSVDGVAMRLAAFFALATVVLCFLAFSATADAAPGDLNGKIALSRFADIYVMNADGRNKTRLTVTKEIEESARFSPDGTKIAFLRRASLTSPRLYVMNADGSDARALTTTPETIESPTWSPDGTKLFYLADRDAISSFAEIYGINIDGSGETLVTATNRRKGL